MLCVAAPPSDHEVKVYELPPWLSGEGAPMERIMPTTLWSVAGVGVAPSMVSPSPAGLLARVSVTTRGVTSRVISVTTPSASVTVAQMRYQTSVAVSPVSAATKLPLEVPAVSGKKG